ncbi:MAG: hypothetical protein AAGG54_08905 [Pseudomonadota bacterium]
MLKAWLFPTLLFGLAGCADFPDLGKSISPEARRAEFPQLVPIEPLLERRNAARTTGLEADRLEARAAALRARAALLRGITIDDDTRQRLTPELNRLGG